MKKISPHKLYEMSKGNDAEYKRLLIKAGHLRKPKTCPRCAKQYVGNKHDCPNKDIELEVEKVKRSGKY